MPASTWSTAVRDWKERIRGKRSLIPDLPLYDAVAEKALRIFKRLRVPDIIGNPTYADAILDRLVHNAYRIDLTGDSLRRTRPKSVAKD